MHVIKIKRIFCVQIRQINASQMNVPVISRIRMILLELCTADLDALGIVEVDWSTVYSNGNDSLSDIIFRWFWQNVHISSGYWTRPSVCVCDFSAIFGAHQCFRTCHIRTLISLHTALIYLPTALAVIKVHHQANHRWNMMF